MGEMPEMSQPKSFNEILAEYESAIDAGRNPDPQVYLERYPEHREELEKFFADQDRIDAMAKPLHSGGGVPALPDLALPTVSYRASGSLTSQERPASNNLPVISGYEILEELGRGGMGVVYKATDQRLKRLVALKMIGAGGQAAAADLARFRTEAEAIARFQHPNIVQVHEIGEYEGKPFFSLEFCIEGSLSQKTNGIPLPPKDAAQVVETLARAVDYAHQRGVIHRDLKPANVLLQSLSTDTQGRHEKDSTSLCLDTSVVQICPKITDFGLAKKLDETGQTATGAIMGTPSYMSPEQAGGDTKTVGPAADIYALGAILYECLTGRPPFRGSSHMDVIRQVLSDDPVPPSRLQPKTPRDLETICLKCLQKRPKRRYATAADLADDLRHFLAGEPIRARPVGVLERIWKWAKRKPAAAGFLVMLLVFLGAASALLINAEVRRQTLLVRQQTLEGEIDQTLKEVARLHMEFGDMLVKLTKDRKKVEHDKWVKDTNAVMENWQTQLRVRFKRAV
jgi:hypothetical protein